MEKSEFLRLVNDVNNDEALKAEFKVVRDVPEKWVALANQKGYGISLEQAKAIEELSDQDLEMVAGGAVSITEIVVEY